MKTPDPFITCYVTDRRSLSGDASEQERGLARCIENAANAGVDWVQIREKDLPARKLVAVTRAAIRACESISPRRDVRVLVNDRWDVAWAARAAGVHLGEKSLPARVVAEARRALGLTDFSVGVSCHSQDAAVKAANDGADYLFFGPVFPTPSKAAFGAPQGLAKLAQVCGAVSIPVVAIGGITTANARTCREAGAAGVAAIRLFQESRDLAEVVAAFVTK